jgi:hypothetical protein
MLSSLKKSVKKRNFNLVHHSARQQLIDWLEHQLSQQQHELAEAEAQLDALLMLIKQKQADIAFLEKRLLAETSATSLENADLEHDALPLNGRASSQRESDNEDCPTNNKEDGFDDEQQDIEEAQEETKRNPKDMMRDEFAGMTLRDAAQKILEEFYHPISTQQITAKMFQADSDDESLRAKNSLAAELRRGAKDGRWQKTERGLFVSNAYALALPIETNNPEI